MQHLPEKPIIDKHLLCAGKTLDQDIFHNGLEILYQKSSIQPSKQNSLIPTISLT